MKPLAFWCMSVSRGTPYQWPQIATYCATSEALAVMGAGENLEKYAIAAGQKDVTTAQKIARECP